MAQYRIRNIIAAGGLLAALVVGVGTDARAFTETKIPPAQPQTTAPALQKPESGEGLSLVKPSDATTGGTELSIPGIGSVGKLPKLDFGLDLLYGAGNDAVSQDRPLESDGKDVTIKGTIRHRF